MAGSEAAKEALYLRGFLSELGLADDGPTTLYMDNKSAIDLAYNPEHHDRMKHVLRRHFFVRDMVEEFEIEVPFVRTDDNIADFLTKPIEGPACQRMSDAASGYASAPPIPARLKYIT